MTPLLVTALELVQAGTGPASIVQTPTPLACTPRHGPATNLIDKLSEAVAKHRPTPSDSACSS
jgi:hypothetical protein